MCALDKHLSFNCLLMILLSSVQVSWIRRKDLQILTSGPVTFSADTRFTPVYSEGRDFWGLRIRSPKIQDTGQYECQVNTDPKIGHIINLTVTGKSINYFGLFI